MEQSLDPESRSFEQGLYELLQKDTVTREECAGGGRLEETIYCG